MSRQHPELREVLELGCVVPTEERDVVDFGDVRLGDTVALYDAKASGLVLSEVRDHLPIHGHRLEASWLVSPDPINAFGGEVEIANRVDSVAIRDLLVFKNSVLNFWLYAGEKSVGMASLRVSSITVSRFALTGALSH